MPRLEDNSEWGYWRIFLAKGAHRFASNSMRLSYSKELDWSSRDFTSNLVLAPESSCFWSSSSHCTKPIINFKPFSTWFQKLKLIVSTSLLESYQYVLNFTFLACFKTDDISVKHHTGAYLEFKHLFSYTAYYRFCKLATQDLKACNTACGPLGNAFCLYSTYKFPLGDLQLFKGIYLYREVVIIVPCNFSCFKLFLFQYCCSRRHVPYNKYTIKGTFRMM